MVRCKLEVMDAVMRTCDCQRRVLLMEGGEGAYAASTALPSVEGRRGNPKTQALTGSHVHPLALGDRESAALLWPRQRHRQQCFCALFWQVGAKGQHCLRKPVCEQPPARVPGAVSGRSLPAAGMLAQLPGIGGPGAAQGPVKPARVEMLREWGFSELGTMLKGRSVTRWSRGRHRSNKCCLHKVSTWVIASLSSLRTKSSGNREGNSPVGSLSVSLLSRNSWEGEGIPRICPSVQGQ